MIKKLNCWEYNECGRNPKGHNVEEFGVCPSSVARHSDNLNCGTNGGRICWTINNTFCKGTEQGSAEDKFGNCTDCDFYKYIRAEEGNNFKLINTSGKIKYKKGTITIDVGLTFSHETIVSFEKKFIETLINSKDIKILLDFKDTVKIDSSALGLLLVFKNYLDVKGACLCLINTSDHVRMIIERIG